MRQHKQKQEGVSYHLYVVDLHVATNCRFQHYDKKSPLYAEKFIRISAGAEISYLLIVAPFFTHFEKSYNMLRATFLLHR